MKRVLFTIFFSFIALILSAINSSAHAMFAIEENSAITSLAKPTITVPSCYAFPQSNSSDIKISLTDRSVSFVDISPSNNPDFRTDSGFFFYNHQVTTIEKSKQVVAGPLDFKAYPKGSLILSVSPANLYYVRLWNGKTYSPTASFTVTLCKMPSTSAYALQKIQTLPAQSAVKALKAAETILTDLLPTTKPTPSTLVSTQPSVQTVKKPSVKNNQLYKAYIAEQKNTPSATPTISQQTIHINNEKLKLLINDFAPQNVVSHNKGAYTDTTLTPTLKTAKLYKAFLNEEKNVPTGYVQEQKATAPQTAATGFGKLVQNVKTTVSEIIPTPGFVSGLRSTKTLVNAAIATTDTPPNTCQYFECEQASGQGSGCHTKISHTPVGVVTLVTNGNNICSLFNWKCSVDKNPDGSTKQCMGSAGTFTYTEIVKQDSSCDTKSHVPVGSQACVSFVNYIYHSCTQGACQLASPTPTSTPTPTPNPTAASTPTPTPVNVSLPTTINLSAYNPPVMAQSKDGDGSCASWATGYYLRGWYAKRDGYYPTGPDVAGGFAPMFLFQQVKYPGMGCYGGSGSDELPNLQAMIDSGIDTRLDFAQGDHTDKTAFDFGKLDPRSLACVANGNNLTAAEKQNALNYKIKGYNVLFVGEDLGNHLFSKTQGPQIAGVDKKQVIMKQLASKNPLILGMYKGSLTHTFFVYGYNQNGVNTLDSFYAPYLNQTFLSWKDVTDNSFVAAGIDPGQYKGTNYPGNPPGNTYTCNTSIYYPGPVDGNSSNSNGTCGVGVNGLDNTTHWYCSNNTWRPTDCGSANTCQYNPNGADMCLTGTYQICQNINYGGTCETVRGNIPSFGVGKDKNSGPQLADNMLSSIRLPQQNLLYPNSVKMAIYIDPNYQGTCRDITQDTPWINSTWNDQVSSLKIGVGCSGQ